LVTETNKKGILKMDFLRRIIKQISTQLGGLKVAEKTVIFLLVIIFAFAVYLMVQYSSQQKMVDLHPQDFTEDELASISQQLSSWGEEHELVGKRIKVPISRRDKILGRLALAQMLPTNMAPGFEQLLADQSVMAPSYIHKDKKMVILQSVLARTIGNYPGVKKKGVIVIIGPGSDRRLNNIKPGATASVSVDTESSVSSDKKKLKALTSAIASFVSGSVDRLKREDVTVIINGQQMQVIPEGAAFANDYIERKADIEKYFREKILKAVPIPNVVVQFDARIENATMTTKTTEIANEDDGSVNAVKKKDSLVDESSNINKNEEPGVVANGSMTGRSSSGGVSEKATTEKGITEYDFHEGSTNKVVQTPPGNIPKEDRTASVSIPWTYFEGVAKTRLKLKEGDSPDFETVETEIIPKVTERWKQIVMHSIGLVGKEYADNVIVDYYFDNDFLKGMVPSGSGGSGGVGGDVGGGGDAAGVTFGGIFGQYGKEIAISALALVSLFMALMMVRKASGPVALSDEEAAAMMKGPKPMDALSLEEANLADGIDSAALLAGIELKEGEVRTQQVIGQIKDLVEDSPEMAANLVSKWVSEDD